MTINKRHFIMGLAATAATPLLAQTSDYPSRTIRIVPFGTGGRPIAIVARSYESALTKRWGQPVIVDAKPGAAGILSTDFADAERELFLARAAVRSNPRAPQAAARLRAAFDTYNTLKPAVLREASEEEWLD